MRARPPADRTCRTAKAPARLLAPGLALLLAAAASGCGVSSADLFAVQRSGAVPGAHLSMVISDGGSVRCDGGPAHPIPDAQLLAARDIQRQLKTPARDHLVLAPGPEHVLAYSVTSPDGSVQWTDTSREQPPVLYRLALLTRQLAQQSCGLPR